MLAFQALSDPTRQRIVELLSHRALSAGEIVERVKMSAPAVSQHLRTLREANLVTVRVDAQRRIYELNLDGVDELSAWIARIRSFWAAKLDALDSALREDDRAKRKTKVNTKRGKRSTRR